MMPAKAKRIIYLHMSGAPPQHELFDWKPELVKHHMQPCPESLMQGQRFPFIKGHPNLLGTPYNSRNTVRRERGSVSCCPKCRSTRTNCA